MKKTIPSEKLTPEYLRAYADSQIEKYLSTGPVDERLAEQHLTHAYKAAGLTPPTSFCWYDSPYQLAEMGDSVRDSVWESAWTSVRTSVWESVWDSVRDSVEESVWKSVWASVRNSVWASVRNSVWKSVRDSVGAWYNAPYTAQIKFFNDNLEKNDLEHICLFDEMVTGYHLTAETAYIVRKPIRLVRDDNGRLHYDHGKAIEWANGYGLYMLHGVEFKEDEWQKIVSQQLDIKDLASLGSADKRAVAVQMLRPDRLLQHMNAKLINTGHKGTKLYQVDNFMDTGDTEYCMVMKHPTLERHYIEWVAPNIGKEHDADLAQAVAFGVSKEYYLTAEEA